VKTSPNVVAGCLVATLIVRGRQQAAAQPHTRVKNPAAPKEPAPPAIAAGALYRRGMLLPRESMIE
jgi:hypothetical protein